MPDAGGMETASVGLVILGPAVVAALIGVDVVGCCTAGVVGCTEGCDAGVVAGTTGLTAAGVVGCSPEWSVLFSLPPEVSSEGSSTGSEGLTIGFPELFTLTITKKPIRSLLKEIVFPSTSESTAVILLSLES